MSCGRLTRQADITLRVPELDRPSQFFAPPDAPFLRSPGRDEPRGIRGAAGRVGRAARTEHGNPLPVLGVAAHLVDPPGPRAALAAARAARGAARRDRAALHRSL